MLIDESGDYRLKSNSRLMVHGQQYPCPAFLFFPYSPLVSRAAAPEGQCPVEYRGYFVRLSVLEGPLFGGPAFKVLAWEPWPVGPGPEALP